MMTYYCSKYIRNKIKTINNKQQNKQAIYHNNDTFIWKSDKIEWTNSASRLKLKGDLSQTTGASTIKKGIQMHRKEITFAILPFTERMMSWW